MKRYEGLFILDVTGEDEIKAVIDRISETMTAAGGKIETVQKMEKRQFSRVADKKHSGGYYVNFVLTIGVDGLRQLKDRFATDDQVFRVLFTRSPEPKTPAPAA